MSASGRSGKTTGHAPISPEPIAPERTARWRLAAATATVLAVFAVAYELRTSALESFLFSRMARRLSYTVEPGPSPSIVFPRGGPSDERRGIVRLPDFTTRLERAGFVVAEQARFSPWLLRLTRLGIAPPFQEPPRPGLVVRGREGVLLLDRTGRARFVFGHMDDVPGVLVKALLFIENRELGEPHDPRRNPAVEWPRLTRAGLTYVGGRLGLPIHAEGGSTLATQLVKFRHSAGGRTHAAREKLQQMLSASLSAYREGPDTDAAREQIVLDYVNTMPLAATPGYGEVTGLGEGLWAWFGRDLDKVRGALSGSDRGSDRVRLSSDAERARVLKESLALLCAARAPSRYLRDHDGALAARVDGFVRLMARAGVLEPGLARAVESTPLRLALANAPPPAMAIPGARKAVDSARRSLTSTLAVTDVHTVDRLDLEVDTTLDASLSDHVAGLFQRLAGRDFLAQNGLIGDRLLSPLDDPERVIYSLLLFERTPHGNALRAQVDNLHEPFDLNEGMKLELGSTAKLRTLAHYLGIVGDLHAELSRLDPESRRACARAARDPITRWVAARFLDEPEPPLADLLESALERAYSASPRETFFTGGGVHTFQNFDSADNFRVVSVREATFRSVNLAYVRLMRDLVRYHEARLPYDVGEVMADPASDTRRRLLVEIGAAESLEELDHAYRGLRETPHAELPLRLLGHQPTTRELAILFFAWRPEPPSEAALARWLDAHGVNPQETSPGSVRRLFTAYGSGRLTLADHAYLLRARPIWLYVAGELDREPGVRLATLKESSRNAKEAASAWLLHPKNRHAQDLRLTIRFERDAFTEMTRAWRRLGFPFESLVPSYASAIGASGDRPAALAEIMGIIVNDGVRKPTLRFDELRFAVGTPYETTFEPAAREGEAVMRPEVARALCEVLARVVEQGTARRLRGAFRSTDSAPLPVGGKTGSGDNRFQTFGRGGRLVASRPVSRTATFVFYVGDRWFGVLTAVVSGEAAGSYRFTSALPVAVLRLLAPELSAPPPARSASLLAGLPAQPAQSRHLSHKEVL